MDINGIISWNFKLTKEHIENLPMLMLDENENEYSIIDRDKKQFFKEVNLNEGARKFEEEIDLSPTNYDLKLIYADYLDDIGRRELANAQRWLGVNKKRVEFLQQPYGVRWSGTSWHYDIRLPYRIYWELDKRGNYYHRVGMELSYRTRQHAERELGIVLRELEIVAVIETEK
jgi:uncharacterized protein (TIGR02996 family)